MVILKTRDLLLKEIFGVRLKRSNHARLSKPYLFPTQKTKCKHLAKEVGSTYKNDF